MPDLALPDAVLVAGDWLRAQTAITAKVEKRIAHKLSSTMPAIRLTDVGPIEQGPEEALVRVQVECWATDYFDAGEIARLVVAAVPEARNTWTNGNCRGATVVAGPFANPDPNSQRFRHQLDVALWLYPTPS